MFREFAAAMKPLEHGACPASTRRRRVATHSQPLRRSKNAPEEGRRGPPHENVVLQRQRREDVAGPSADTRRRSDVNVSLGAPALPPRQVRALSARSGGKGRRVHRSVNDGLMGPPVWGAKKDPGLQTWRAWTPRTTTSCRRRRPDDPTSEDGRSARTRTAQAPQPFCAMKHIDAGAASINYGAPKTASARACALRRPPEALEDGRRRPARLRSSTARTSSAASRRRRNWSAARPRSRRRGQAGREEYLLLVLKGDRPLRSADDASHPGRRRLPLGRHRRRSGEKVLAQVQEARARRGPRATVQTAGVGLNIVEANNVVFTKVVQRCIARCGARQI